MRSTLSLLQGKALNICIGNWSQSSNNEEYKLLQLWEKW